MRMIAIIKHAQIEGPGTLQNFFRETFFDTHVFELWRGERLPAFDECEAILSLGGPMNVYETDRYPFLRDEEDYIQKALDRNIPFLGICLGAQLLAKTCGASVTKASQEEIGWFAVTFTPEAHHDALFGNLADSIDVFQWHQDTFALPNAAVLLATADTCRNQAFRVGECAWGLQFHPEMTEVMLRAWLTDCPDHVDKVTLMYEYSKKRSKYQKQAKQMYLNFERAVAGRLSVKK
jgi:GMP synthase (glutamine-hydrolysing)